MTPAIGITLLSFLLVGLIGIAISKAVDDGFFTSLCTLLVLYSAYQFARLEWDFFFQFLTARGMNNIQAISTGFWLGFLLIVGPGLVVARLLAKPKVPFPYPFEKYGSMVIGAGAGILIFATLIQWLLHSGLLSQSFDTPLGIFSPIFHFLGYRSEGFS